MTTTQATETDIRIAAWAFGRKVTGMGHAYRLLEAGHADAVRVFAALQRNEWGVKAAFADGLNGVDITARADAVTTVAWTGGDKYPEPLIRRTIVAANGGTVA
jgi:hypothetical protein